MPRGPAADTVGGHHRGQYGGVGSQDGGGG